MHSQTSVTYFTFHQLERSPTSHQDRHQRRYTEYTKATLLEDDNSVGNVPAKYFPLQTLLILIKCIAYIPTVNILPFMSLISSLFYLFYTSKTIEKALFQSFLPPSPLTKISIEKYKNQHPVEKIKKQIFNSFILFQKTCN